MAPARLSLLGALSVMGILFLVTGRWDADVGSNRALREPRGAGLSRKLKAHGFRSEGWLTKRFVRCNDLCQLLGCQPSDFQFDPNAPFTYPGMESVARWKAIAENPWLADLYYPLEPKSAWEQMLDWLPESSSLRGRSPSLAERQAELDDIYVHCYRPSWTLCRQGYVCQIRLADPSNQPEDLGEAIVHVTIQEWPDE